MSEHKQTHEPLYGVEVNYTGGEMININPHGKRIIIGQGFLSTESFDIVLHDYDGGNQVRIWHNGERWMVRLDERALGDHNNFECADEWQLRNREEAHEQFVDGFDDIPIVDV